MSEFDYKAALLHMKEISKIPLKESFNKDSLSPDEQQQLKEYIMSLKEIKKSIKELVVKSKRSLGETPKPSAPDQIIAPKQPN